MVVSGVHVLYDCIICLRMVPKVQFNPILKGIWGFVVKHHIVCNKKDLEFCDVFCLKSRRMLLSCVFIVFSRYNAACCKAEWMKLSNSYNRWTSGPNHNRLSLKLFGKCLCIRSVIRFIYIHIGQTNTLHPEKLASKKFGYLAGDR